LNAIFALNESFYGGNWSGKWRFDVFFSFHDCYSMSSPWKEQYTFFYFFFALMPKYGCKIFHCQCCLYVFIFNLTDTFSKRDVQELNLTRFERRQRPFRKGFRFVLGKIRKILRVLFFNVVVVVSLAQKWSAQTVQNFFFFENVFIFFFVRRYFFLLFFA